MGSLAMKSRVEYDSAAGRGGARRNTEAYNMRMCLLREEDMVGARIAAALASPLEANWELTGECWMRSRHIGVTKEGDPEPSTGRVGTPEGPSSGFGDRSIAGEGEMKECSSRKPFLD